MEMSREEVEEILREIEQDQRKLKAILEDIDQYTAMSKRGILTSDEFVMNVILCFKKFGYEI
jgi:hypothetical protein